MAPKTKAKPKPEVTFETTRKSLRLAKLQSKETGIASPKTKSGARVEPSSFSPVQSGLNLPAAKPDAVYTQPGLFFGAAANRDPLFSSSHPFKVQKIKSPPAAMGGRLRPVGILRGETLYAQGSDDGDAETADVDTDVLSVDDNSIDNTIYPAILMNGKTNGKGKAKANTLPAVFPLNKSQQDNNNQPLHPRDALKIIKTTGPWLEFDPHLLLSIYTNTFDPASLCHLDRSASLASRFREPEFGETPETWFHGFSMYKSVINRFFGSQYPRLEPMMELFMTRILNHYARDYDWKNAVLPFVLEFHRERIREGRRLEWKAWALSHYQIEKACGKWPLFEIYGDGGGFEESSCF